MINADMRSYEYYMYNTTDNYGQLRLSTKPVGTTKIAIYATNQSIQDNINYKDASYIGLTLDKSITDAYCLQYGTEKLKVLYVNPVGRFRQVFLKKI